MPGPPTSLPTFNKGEQLKASQLNQIADAILRRIQGGPGLDVRAFNSQIILSLVGQDAKLPIGVHMQVRNDQGDHIVCRTLDANGVVGPADVFVQKPWILRRTPFENLTVNGVAYTYVSNGERVADETETQKITQDYFLGAEITVIRTNISMNISPEVFTTLIDSNDSGRKWCAV